MAELTPSGSSTRPPAGPVPNLSWDPPGNGDASERDQLDAVLASWAAPHIRRTAGA